MLHFKAHYLSFLKFNEICVKKMINIEIDNNERGVKGDFTMISAIRIMKAEPE